MIVVDTNVISELAKSTPHESVLRWFEQQTTEPLFLTSVSVAELRIGVHSMPEGKRKRQLDQFVTGVVEGIFRDRIMPFDYAAAEIYALLVPKMKSQGLNIKAHDLMIAAIAMQFDTPVATRNVKDFEPCGVEIINPFETK